MSRSLLNVVAVLVGLLVSGMAFAQGDAAGGKDGLVAIGAGLAIGLAALGAATGQGRTAGAAMEGISRNPQARGEMFLSFILGLVFMEFQALLGFTIAFMWTGG